MEPLESRIDDLCNEMKTRHVSRLTKGQCTFQQGYIFNDLLSNFERISDHSVNILDAVVEMREKGISFSEDASAELNVLVRALSNMTSGTMASTIAKNQKLIDRNLARMNDTFREMNAASAP